eukprot:1778384-Heterocapsa_arctica.AAC.1
MGVLRACVIRSTQLLSMYSDRSIARSVDQNVVAQRMVIARALPDGLLPRKLQNKQTMLRQSPI